MDAKEIVNLAERNPVAREFFADLARRERNYRVTTVDRAATITGAERNEVEEMFRELETCGVGRYMNRRGRGKGRFIWSVPMINVGRAAFGEEADLEPFTEDLEIDEEEGGEDQEEGFVTHVFRLRPGEDPLEFSLPEDLTKEEARRLSRFISCLPFESGLDDDFDF